MTHAEGHLIGNHTYGHIQRVLVKAKENGIILLHDYYETSVEAALQIVDALTEEGYTFVTVDEILFD